jgi:hypothetical protein
VSMSAARRLVLPACSALLLVVVALTVHDDVAHRSLRPDAATAELLGSPPAPTAAAPKTAAHDAQVRRRVRLSLRHRGVVRCCSCGGRTARRGGPCA